MRLAFCYLEVRSDRYIRLGPTILAQFTTTFQTHVFSVLPGSFSQGFKSLVATTLNPEYSSKPPVWVAGLFKSNDSSLRWDQPLWIAFEQLGMLERYESLISSVCYEHIESHILETCTKVWDKESLSEMRAWMTNQIVPWLLLPYARGAKTSMSPSVDLSCSDTDNPCAAEEARAMLTGIGSRLDYHVCKTLADLRYV